MRKLVLSFCVLFSLTSLAQNSTKGKVVDSENNKPLVGATVIVTNSYNGTYTDGEGKFRLSKIQDNKANLVVSYIGYKTDTITVDLFKVDEIVIYLEQLSYQTDEVIVSGTRVSAGVPSTQTTVDKEEIAKNNLGQDLPYLIQQTPSVVTTSDAGTGIGYTGIRIRGSDASRINVTINGVPLNDPESHGVFWVNMPDFSSSLNSVQVQRGIGTSTNGAGAFGATINLETNTVSPKAYGEISNSIGFLENGSNGESMEYNSRKQ